jgi:DNA-binding PadR family transcriptional regulator
MSGDQLDVWQGTLALMVLKTFELKGPMHGCRTERRIEQTSGDLLLAKYGTSYRVWEQAVAILARFFAPSEGA